jgi:hypothetical protein
VTSWRSIPAVAAALTIACGAIQCHAPVVAPVAPKAAASRPEIAADAAAPPEATAEALPPLPLADPPAASAPGIELPRGGRELFPANRLVGWCGTPGAPALGRLTGNLPNKAKQLVAHADKHARPGESRKVLPVFELIAVVVQGGPGNDGKWRRRVPDSVVDDYLKEARAAKGLLLLNIQPGHSDFLTEAKHFDRWLRLPEVGLALDPEWAMNGKQKPGASFGQTSGAAINAVADYLARIVEEGGLPEKALVYHQVNGHVVKDEAVLSAHPGVVMIQSVDGLGPKGSKVKTYDFLVKTKPSAVHAGFKLFFDEDTTNGGKLMTPAEVLALSPEPEYVMYE